MPGLVSDTGETMVKGLTDSRDHLCSELGADTA